MTDTFADIFDKTIEAVKSVDPDENLTANVNLETKLDTLAEGTPLKWRESVTDFLKLIDADDGAKAKSLLCLELNVDSSLKGPEKDEALRQALYRKIADRDERFRHLYQII